MAGSDAVFLAAGFFAAGFLAVVFAVVDFAAVVFAAAFFCDGGRYTLEAAGAGEPVIGANRSTQLLPLVLPGDDVKAALRDLNIYLFTNLPA